MADEPKKLKSIKDLLSLFKLEKLLLRMKGMKQGAEYAGAQTKMNLMNLIGEGGLTDEAEGFTAEDFERQEALLDSLGIEIDKTDSLLNVLGQDAFEGSNVETESDIDLDSSDVVEDFVFGMLGGTKLKAAMNVSGKLGLGKGGSEAVKKILKESDIDILNTTFGKRIFFDTLKGLQQGLIDPTNNKYGRALRFQKIYDKFF